MSDKFEQSQGLHEITWLGREVWLIIEPWGELVIAKLGAQVLHFKPLGQQPVFWLNQVDPVSVQDKATAEPPLTTEAIRGGAPLCWPWFGVHETDAAQPNHGFARVSQWQLDEYQLQTNGTGSTKLRLSAIGELFAPLSVHFEIEVIDSQLRMELVTRNVSDQPQALTQAIHSYFWVQDSRAVKVLGLKGCDFIDKLAANSLGHQGDELVDIQAIDSIYKHSGDVKIIDAKLGRVLLITQQGSGSTVVWNPGQAAKKYNISKGQQHFLCVEAANTAHEKLLLAPNQVVSLMQAIKIEPLDL